MVTIESSLSQIANSLAQLGHRSVTLLQPPLEASEREAIWCAQPFVPTLELKVLYGWRNGTRARPGDCLDELAFFPGFYLLSMEEAVRTYLERLDADNWQANWFPLFANGAGDFYVVPCPSFSAEASVVIGYIHGEPEQLVEFQSLSTMLNTLSEAYALGAIYVDAEGCLEFDDERFRQIAHRFNPGLDVWRS